MSEREYDPENLEEGDSFPCPGCSPTSIPDELRDLSPEHWGGEIADVINEYVQCEHCRSYYHRKLLIPEDEVESRKAVGRIFDGPHGTPPVGEWVSDFEGVRGFRMENPVLVDAAGLSSPDVQTDVDVDTSFDIDATTYVSKTYLLKTLRAMDGDMIRLDVMHEGLVFLSAVNWKHQRMQATVAPRDPDSRMVDRLDDQLGDWLGIFEQKGGDQ